MDFIKIPVFTEDASEKQVERDAIIRISDIKAVSVAIMEDSECSIIIGTDKKVLVRTPMSVAKIYDLIWQTELSNSTRHKDE